MLFSLCSQSSEILDDKHIPESEVEKNLKVLIGQLCYLLIR